MEQQSKLIEAVGWVELYPIKNHLSNPSFLNKLQDELLTFVDLFEANIVRNYILGSFEGIDALLYFATGEVISN